MKLLYAGKNINHHQVPFVKSLMSILGKDKVKYSSIKMIEPERLKMGFELFEGDWLIDAINQKEIFEEWWDKADVVITNNREYYNLIERRLKKGQLVFFTSERWFKEPEGFLRLFHPHILSLVLKFRRLTKYPNFYYLPQGYFSYYDLARLGILKDKAFSFGYLTPNYIGRQKDSNYIDKNKLNIIWAGSLIKLKRVDLLAEAFCHIHKQFPDTYLTIIGEGPEKDNILSILRNGDASQSYKIMDFVGNAELRSIMNASDIYVFPSSGAEGWGAVVNEAMKEGCAVILSNKVGSISMINDRHNGLIFQNGSVSSLCEALRLVCKDQQFLHMIQTNAVKTIENEWNPDIAAKRFIELCINLPKNGSYEIQNVELLKRL